MKESIILILDSWGGEGGVMYLLLNLFTSSTIFSIASCFPRLLQEASDFSRIKLNEDHSGGR